MSPAVQVRELSDSIPAKSSLAEALIMRRLLDSLPSAQKTPAAITLLKTYFHIPQPSIRRFVLVLLARITGSKDITTYPSGDLSEAEYILTQYTRLSTDDMRDKVLSLVRQICTANRGDM